jgi:hypothetical protein
MDQKLLPRLARLLTRLRLRAARWRVALLGVLVVAVVTATLATILKPDSSPPSGTSPTWVGVHEGFSIPMYIEANHARLAALVAADPQRVAYALVSLRDYFAPAEVAVMFAGITSVTAFARVPLPGKQTELVDLAAVRLPADLVAGMAALADRKVADADYYDRLAQAEPQGTLRGIYRSNADLSRAEADAYRSGCACVFALVVRASASALAALETAANVRTVDVEPELTDPGQAVFSPPLPEQTDRATPPDDDLPTTPSG